MRFIWTNSELQRAAKHRRETKKGFTVALTAVLTRSGSIAGRLKSSMLAGMLVWLTIHNVQNSST